jgi:hypothetical protein
MELEYEVGIGIGIGGASYAEKNRPVPVRTVM